MIDPTDLRGLEDEEIFGEIRRRKLPDYKVRDALNLSDLYFQPDSNMVLRRQALMILGALTLVLVMIIGFLAVTSKDIPDLISGLAGSGVGAIAGILAGGSSGSSGGGAASRSP